MVLFEKLKNEIPSREAQFREGAVYIDRFYDVKPAGTLLKCDTFTMKHCLEHLKGRETPEITKRMGRWTNPGVGERRLFHALVNDPEIETAKVMKHGALSKDRTEVKDVIRPPEPTVLGEMLTKVREEIYESVKKPLGCSPVQNLPSHIDKYKTTFGIKHEPGDRVGELVNPPRKRVDIKNQELDDREHYLVSHKHLLPGEQAHRRYENFDKNQVFGIHTYCDPSGIHVRHAMNWIANTSTSTPITNQRQIDFKEKYDHVLGKVRDPIKDTMNVPDDYTFGLCSKDNDITAGQLLHDLLPRRIAGLPVEDSIGQQNDTNAKRFISSGERLKAMLSVIHHALRNQRYYHGSEITTALCQLANKSDLIPMIDARRIYNHFQVPLDEELTEQLFDLVIVPAPKEMIDKMKETLKKNKENYTNTEKNYHIEKDLLNWAVDWRKLGLLLDCKRLYNWNDDKSLMHERGYGSMNDAKPEVNENIGTVRRRLRRAIQANLHYWTTTNSTYAGNQNALINTDNWTRLGENYLQLHRPVPKSRSCSDYTNYGDEAGVGSILNPSIFTDYGLSSRDLLVLRNKQEILDIFNQANLSSLFGSPLSFDQVWELGLKLDKELLGSKASGTNDQTTLQSFKTALWKLRSDGIQEKVTHEYAQKC